MTVKSYENSGLLVLGDAPPAREKTIVVMGLARSGTSLVAGSLHELGVWMGAAAPPPVYEDKGLGSAVEAGDMAAVRALIAEYDAAHPVWGWKRPASLHHIESIHRTLRNPVYVVIFRDIFAIANRNRISVGSDVLGNMRRSLDEYGKLLKFLQSASPPALLVSYDKALRHREDFVARLCDFLGLSADAAARQRAVEFITPSPEAYLESTRAGRVVGHVDVVREDLVFGWAARHADHREVMDVVLEVDGRPVAATRADQSRPDLKKHGAHRTGNAGYSFRLEGENRLHGGEEIRVFAGAERKELKNSPWRFEAEAGTVARGGAGGTGRGSGDRPLIFLHIPKTAGTSLRGLFRERVEAGAFAELDPPIAEQARARIVERRDGLRLLIGHLYFGVGEQLGIDADYATFLRDPVARVVSFWKHQVTHPHAEFHRVAKEGLSLREFVESERTIQTDNHMTRILIGTGAKGLLDGSRTRIDAPGLLEQALENVRSRFRFVGFVEDFGASVEALGEVLGWPGGRPFERRLNALNSSPDHLDDATLAAIREHNALDIELYARLRSEATWLRAGQ